MGETEDDSNNNNNRTNKNEEEEDDEEEERVIAESEEENPVESDSSEATEDEAFPAAAQAEAAEHEAEEEEEQKNIDQMEEELPVKDSLITPDEPPPLQAEPAIPNVEDDAKAVSLDHIDSPFKAANATDVADEKTDVKNENGGEVAETVVVAAMEIEGQEEKDIKEGPLREEKVETKVVEEPKEEKAEVLSNETVTGVNWMDGDDLGTEEEQAGFMRELERFHREKSLDFKPPKFYGEGLNCLKLWRAVTRLGGYERVTSCKLWRQVGESFKPPKTCTTVSWSFRCFYEKALLEYEKHKIRGGELQVPAAAALPEIVAVENHVGGNQASGSGRARRDAAARAMQGWHSQRYLSNGEVADPIIKDKSSLALSKREKQLKNLGLKRKKPSGLERSVKAVRPKLNRPQSDTMVVDIGTRADWVKISVQRTKDCFEVYALVPGLLREEVHVQSDPAGRLVISGEPEHLDNPWGVTPFKKVISLPSRIDPHQTSAVVTLHGQLFVRAPFEQSV
ncbi:AT-rich interactive domain-containing protein 3 [Acorus calamus]|uniref:AT-rich interactive domain-containing protein 3 n=1 Tax=Acorus calamus TaxID=4465 RepID=A0AAV9EJG0_ACOCL|nr:AT-rich interactive domain-containing protein 3 [Acorus calamus]